MLEPGERSLLLETLTPPEGFVLDEGIGTTYTLDLISLLSVPLAFTMFEWEDKDGSPNKDPILLLEALRRHMGRLTVFCQAGRTSAPAKPNPLYTYLEEAVVEVRPPSGVGVFHPKVWVLRFTGLEGAVRYRFVCLTRNLTEDRSWDLSLVLEGTPKDRQRAIASSKPLGDFVAALPGLAVREAPPAVRERAERLGAELRRVEWEVPEPFASCEFYPLGIAGYKKDPTIFDSTQGLVVSPFLSEEQVEMWAEPENVLVSRAEELDKIPPQLLKGFGEVLVLKPEASPQDEGEVDGGASQPGLHGLHAKCYVADTGWDTRAFIGSANLTDPAFDGRNVEFLTELRGKKSKCGVDGFLNGGAGEASFRALLDRYTPPDGGVVVDTIGNKLDDLVNAARDAMSTAAWRFLASEGENGTTRFALERSGGKLPLPKECEVKVWPITLPWQSAAHVIEPAAKSVSFGVVAPTALTTFLAVEVVARTEGRVLDARFVLNLPLHGAPADRRDKVLQSILDDPDKVMRFLRFLLEDGDVASAGAEAFPASGEAVGAGRGGNFVLLESMLRALTRDPSRLDHVHRLMKELGEGDEAKKRLPPGLLDIWPAIWGAREESAR